MEMKRRVRWFSGGGLALLLCLACVPSAFAANSSPTQTIDSFNDSINGTGLVLNGSAQDPILWNSDYTITQSSGSVAGDIGGGNVGTFDFSGGTFSASVNGTANISMTGGTITASVNNGGYLNVTGTTTTTGNSISFGGTAEVDLNNANASFTTIAVGTGSEVSLRQGTVTGGVTMTGSNQTFLLSGASLSGTSTIGQSSDIRITSGSLSGSLSTTDTTGTNIWRVQGGTHGSGVLTGGGAMDTFHMSGGTTGTVQSTAGNSAFNISGSNTYITNAQSSSGVSTFTITGGHTTNITNTATGTGTAGNYKLNGHTNTYGSIDQVVKNITGSTHADTVDTLTVADGIRFTEYNNINDAYAASGNAAIRADIDNVLNMESVILGVNSGLEIGRRDVAGATRFTADSVTLGMGSDLFIHKSTSAQASEIGSVTWTGSGSVLWIDRTTVTGLANGNTTIQIGAGGMITGYSDNIAGYNNIKGDLVIGSEGILNPFSTQHNITEFYNDTSIQYADARNHRQSEGMAVSGNTAMNGGAIMTSRLFAIQDAGNSVTLVNSGDTVDIYHGDFVQTGSSTFNGKAIFDPIFGSAYEVGAKQEFKLYTGDGTTNDNTYFFDIVRSGVDVNGYAGTGSAIDANDLFDNQIIKSDMLGEWHFEMAENGTDVIVRFRLLAKHPTQGGIAVDMIEPNAEAAARELDRIRYPDDGSGRYNGKMKETYEKLHAANPEKYPNYKDYYIDDYEQLLLNIQNVIATGANTNHAIRRLHPEPYADLANINIRTVDTFVRTREQHGISSLFQVENEQFEAAMARAEGNDNAYANLVMSDGPVMEEYIRNPIRFWASGFGADGNQKKNGTEYGFDSEMWGGAIGMMKEWGNFYVGLSGGYARVSTDWKELTATAKSDAYMADALIGYRFGLGFIEAYGNYAYNDHKTSRNLSFANYSGVARGSYHDNVYGGGVRLGYQHLVCDSWLFIPTIGVNYIKSRSAAFTEDGRYNLFPKLDVAAGGIRRQNLRVPLTARLSRPFVFMDSVVTPELRASFIPIFGDKRAKATARFAGDPSADGRFTAVGIENGRWAGQVGGTLEISRRGRMNITANYDYTFARKSYEHNYSLMFGMNF